MPAPRHPDPATEYRAVAAVRVPHDDGDDLATSASRRLETPPDVRAVEVDELRDLDPALSATVVTAAVDVTATARVGDASLEGQLASGPGVESVRDVSRR